MNGNGNGEAVLDEEALSAESDVRRLERLIREADERARLEADRERAMHESTEQRLDEQRARLDRHEADEAERHGVVLAALARIERVQIHQSALLEALRPRVAYLTRGLETHDGSIRLLDTDATATRKRLADRAQRDTIGRVRLEERVSALERRDDRLHDEITGAGQQAAVGVELGRRALDSVHDGQATKHEARVEEVRGRWALKLTTRQAIVGGVVSLALVAALTLLRWGFGAANVPSLPAPAAPAPVVAPAH